MSSTSRRSLLLAGLAACHRPEPPAPDAAPRVLAPHGEPSGAPGARGLGPGPSGWQGTVRLPVNDGARGKVFEGAWLETGDGKRWVITYDVRSPLRALRDEVVTIEGHPYQPEGQALIDGHLRVRSVRAANPQARLRAVGPERTLRGSFRQVAGASGSKSAGEVSERLVEDGGAEHSLASAPWWPDADQDAAAGQRGSQPRAARPEYGQAVEVTAHDVELSPFAAHAGGAWVWVTRWSPAR